MPPAATLTAAANDASTNLTTSWIAQTLIADLTAFAAAANALFDEQLESNHPVIDWCAIISGLARQLTVAAVATFVDATSAIQFVYRLCRLAEDGTNPSGYLITAGQKTALLAAYNTHLV